MIEKSLTTKGSPDDFDQIKELFDKNQLLKIILGNINDILIVFEKDGLIKYINPSFQKFLNYAKQELIGKNIFDYVHPDDQSSVMRSFAQLIESGTVKNYFRFQDKDGKYVWFDAAGTSLPGEKNSATCIVMCCKCVANGKQGEEEALMGKIIFEAMIEGMPGIFCCVDDQFQIKKWNKNFEKISGYSAQELYGMSPLDFIVGDEKKFIAEKMDEAFIQGEINGEVEFVSRDGHKTPYLFHIYPIIIRDRMHLIGIGIDISIRKKAERELRKIKERFDIAIEGTEAGVWDWDMLEDMVVYSAQWKKMLGYDDADIENSFNGWKKIWHPDDAPLIEKAISDHMNGESEKYEIVYRCHHKNGDWRWLVTRGKILRGENGKPYRWVGTNIDITPLKQAEEKIQYLAYHDNLTDLPNRELFFDRFGIALALAQRNKNNLAVIMLDLDNFKRVNDSFGHAFGDLVLKASTEKLNAALRKGDTVARFGGDEFVLILSDLKGVEDAINVANKIVENFRKPFIVESREIQVTTSVGIALYPNDGADEKTLLKKADIAMYQVKQTGRDNYRLYKEG